MISSNERLSWHAAVREAGRAFHVTWGVSRPFSVALLTATIAGALIPAGLAVSVGRLAGTVRVSPEVAPIEWHFAFWLCAAITLLALAALCKVIGTYASEVLGRKLDLRVSRSVLLHLAKLDQEFFEDPQCQDQLTRARANPGRNSFAFVVSSAQAMAATVQAASIVAILVWVDVAAGLFLAALTIPTAMVQWRLARVRYRAARNKVTRQRWTAYYLKTCSAHHKTPTLKVFGLFSWMADRFCENMRELNAIEEETCRTQAVGHALEAMILIAGLFITAAWLGYRSSQGALGVEEFVTFWVAATQFRAAVASFQSSGGQAFELLLFLQELSGFFRESPRIPPEQGIEPAKLQGEIKLRGVAFTYRGGRVPAVKGVNLDLEAGEMVALVGPNGAGKTTLAKLILRLYNAGEGTIHVDGHDIRDLHLGRYHEQIGYVGHFPIDFEATVAESIGYGDWRRLMKAPERIREVARSLGLDKMIDNMPNGYATRLGRRFGEHNLSAGQWQKVAIARAVARDPAILILDEPTANLDARYEFELLSALRSISHGRTTIIISHRLTTLRMADRIVVMNAGQVADIGRHEELIKQDGIYTKLFGAQCRNAA